MSSQGELTRGGACLLYGFAFAVLLLLAVDYLAGPVGGPMFESALASILHPAPSCDVAVNLVAERHGVAVGLLQRFASGSALTCGAARPDGTRVVTVSWSAGSGRYVATYWVSQAGAVAPGDDNALRIDQYEALGGGLLRTFFGFP